MRQYGVLASVQGLGSTTIEDSARCVEEIYIGVCGHQCKRKRGHGPDGLWCKQHANRRFPPKVSRDSEP